MDWTDGFSFCIYQYVWWGWCSGKVKDEGLNDEVDKIWWFNWWWSSDRWSKDIENGLNGDLRIKIEVNPSILVLSSWIKVKDQDQVIKSPTDSSNQHPSRTVDEKESNMIIIITKTKTEN